MKTHTDENLEPKLAPPLQKPPEAQALRITTGFLYLIVWGVVLLSAGKLFKGVRFELWMSSWLGQGVAVIAIALLGTLAWKARSFVTWILTSTSFAVSLLTFILVVTIFGTLILQSAGEQEYIKRYGTTLASLLFWLGLDDVFHTFWFNSLLATLSVSLLLVVARRKSWHWTHWGPPFAHVGVVVVLLGGLLGNLFGSKGFLDLHVGQSVSEVVRMEKGIPTSAKEPLGFILRLERFNIERYPPEYRFYVFEVAGKDYRVVKSYKLDEAKEWRTIGKENEAFRLKEVYPDFELKTELAEAPPGEGYPALQLDLKEGNRARGLILFAGVRGRDEVNLPRSKAGLKFVWDLPSEAELAERAKPQSEAHTLLFKKDENASWEKIAVQAGGHYTAALGEYEVQVLGYLPDFIYDTQKKEATSRSRIPNNPALQISIRKRDSPSEEKRWLFARMPDYGHKHEGSEWPQISYTYTPTYVPHEREFIVVGKTQEVLELKQGVKLRQSLLAFGKEETVAPGERLSYVKLLAAAQELHKPQTRSTQWRKPAVEVEIRKGERTEQTLLSAVHSTPVALSDGETFLDFEKKPDDIKAFHSQLAVLNSRGEKLIEKAVAVNDPLSYGGYHFYQSNYRKEDPTYSGILVVKDPGLTVVYVGFVILCIGVIFSFYLPKKNGVKKEGVSLKIGV